MDDRILSHTHMFGGKKVDNYATPVCMVHLRVPNKEKTGYFVPGYFFVAKGDEISNYDLIMDMESINNIHWITKQVKDIFNDNLFKLFKFCLNYDCIVI